MANIFNVGPSIFEYMKGPMEMGIKYQREAIEREVLKAQAEQYRQKTELLKDPKYNQSQLPSVLQINYAMKDALARGDTAEYNRLAWLARAGAYGINSAAAEMPVDQGASQGYTPQVPNYLTEAPISSQEGQQPSPIAQQPPVMTEPQGSYSKTIVPMPTGLNPIAQQLAANAAAKKEAETQAQKNVELTEDPKIEAAKLRAKYIEEGYQQLPKLQRSLQTRELKAEFLNPKIDSILQRANSLTTGWTGSLAAAMPGTPAFDLKKDIDTLLAASGFDTLQEMRDNSPLGGALGNITEREIEYLQASMQNLINSQSKEQFIANLKAFKAQRERSLANVRAAYDEDYKRFGGSKDSYLPAPQTLNNTTQSSNIPAGWKIKKLK